MSFPWSSEIVGKTQRKFGGRLLRKSLRKLPVAREVGLVDGQELSPARVANTLVSMIERDSSLESIVNEHETSGRLLSLLTVVRAAEQMQNARAEWSGSRSVRVHLTDRTIPLNSAFGAESMVGLAISANKALTRKLLEQANVSVPAGMTVRSGEEAIAAQKKIGSSVVLKPVGGGLGRGVTVNVSSPEDVLQGYKHAVAYGRLVLVEQYVAGYEYRIHATPTRCVGAFRRLLPNVTGDGISTIRELAERKNEERKLHPTTAHYPIPLDGIAEGFLRRSGLDWETIPENGRHVIIRDVNGLTSGGDSESCFYTMRESTKQTAVDAIAALPGMEWGGVDIIEDDETGQAYVIEVNTQASFNGTSFPVYGERVDVGKELWKELYLNSRPAVGGELEPIRHRSGSPQAVVDADISSTGHIPLDVLLQYSLVTQGYEVEKYSQSVWTVQETDQEPGVRVQWFAGCLSTNDLVVAANPMRKRHLWTEAISSANLPRLAGRYVKKIKDLQSYRQHLGGDVILVPGGRHQSSGEFIVLESGQEIDRKLFSSRSEWYVMPRREGLRLRIIASEEKALAIIRRSPGRDVIADDVLQNAADLAVRAVRAMPQCRWAAVDIVEISDTAVIPSISNLYIEEMSHRPRFRRRDRVVAGSMQDVFTMILS